MVKSPTEHYTRKSKASAENVCIGMGIDVNYIGKNPDYGS